MPLIQTVSPQDAQGKVKEVYDQVSAAFGAPPNALQIYSASPALLAEHWQSIGYYMQHPTLNFALLAMMRMLVSQQGHCEYCVGFNESLLINHAGFSIEQVQAAKRDPASAPLPPKDVAMLLFTLKAARDSNSVTATDIDALRKAGWSDADILDGLNHAANMLAADMLLNALKVENDF
ncbi:MAG: hypothetical protein M0T86_07090 [Betaproteobacteria bacterium]|nr:hypothetical protein [Betaproteobacteria bacterium]